MDIPDIDQLCEQLAICLPNGPSRVYAYTDRIGGFWQGQTYDYNSPSGGYIIDGQLWFNDFVLMQNGELIDKCRAKQVTIYPHQIRHCYTNRITVDICVLYHRHGIVRKNMDKYYI